MPRNSSANVAKRAAYTSWVPSALAALSLVSIADMVLGYHVGDPLVWATLFFAVSIGCAAFARHGGRASLAAEPFSMGIMTVLSIFHRHGIVAPSAATFSSDAGHAAHLGGPMVVALAAVLLALCLVCVRCAYGLVEFDGFRRGLLPAASAIAMCVTSSTMILKL